MLNRSYRASLLAYWKPAGATKEILIRKLTTDHLYNIENFLACMGRLNKYAGLIFEIQQELAFRDEIRVFNARMESRNKYSPSVGNRGGSILYGVPGYPTGARAKQVDSV